MSRNLGLSVLRSIRGNLKGSLTKLGTFTEKITDIVTLEALEVRLEKLEDLWCKFDTSQGQMYALAEDEGYSDPEPDFEEFESKYLVIKSILLSSIRDRKKPEMNQVQVNPSHNTQIPVQTQSNTSNSEAVNTLRNVQNPLQQQSDTTHFIENFPKFHIEPFSGNYREWPSFRDMFESSVHNKENLSATQKFYFLRSSLRGDALNLLSHIPLSDATYEQAWERLEKRYNRPRYIINSLVETIVKLPSLQSSNVGTLRKISDCADEISRGLNSLNSFERDPWMIYIIVSKLDPDTRQAWSAHSIDFEYPTIQQFLNFLERRCEALESCRANTRESIKRPPVFKSMHVSSSNQCPICNSLHMPSQCTQFAAMNIGARRELVKSKQLCFNCLRSGHSSARCQSKFRCKICNGRHHSLVHPCTVNCEKSNQSTESNPHSPSSSSISHLVTNNTINIAQCLPQTLLPTAIGTVIDSQGKHQHVRLLIDSGSQVSFVTESCIQRLGLRRTNARIPISGIGANCAGTSRGLASMVIYSRFNSASISVDTLILSNITSVMPSASFDLKDWDHISNLNLADPSFNRSSAVDILLGADKVWEILLSEIVRGLNGQPIAQKTIFGWILAGQLCSRVEQDIQSHHSILDIDSTLQAFWTIEEVDPESILSTEDKAIEEHFIKTHRRSKDGKYIVNLPFKNQPVFANTVVGAISRLSAMERKMSRNSALAQSYSKFLEEYLLLGHMRKIPASEISRPNVFYLPHHAVFKPDSASTKIRVVFDGSFKDTCGNSLNDSLLIGPPIQRNLFSVCLRFRRHKYVFTADIIKMFRQIWVSDEDTDYQRIVWRKAESDPIEHYRLCTVTYGTSCAPYLSVRVLKQLAYDYQKEHPMAAEILLNDFYVDDVVSGGDTLTDAMLKKRCLIELLSKGGLKLSKWQSNCTELLQSQGDLNQNKIISLDSEADSWVKVLGLSWNPKIDCFSFRLNIATNGPVTKRQILREVARVFDPLGFLAPSIVQLKIILQELWFRKVNWDDPLPEFIVTRWLNYRQQLPELTKITIPRCIGIADVSFQLHGFSDASTSAYAAVIYSRHTLANGSIQTNIIAAKSRVAPIKQLSIPRLELCGALLLARLLVSVQRSLNTRFSNVYAWSDSQVVLSWLSSPSRRWDIFVGNRTSEILNTIPRNRWFHIRSEQNPADCASRGIPPSDLVHHPIWWTGPYWLRNSENHWPIEHHFQEHPNCKEEERKLYQRSCLIVNVDHPFNIVLPRVSSWIRLVRIIAFIYRFIAKSRKLSIATSHQLRPQEIYNAKRKLVKWMQHICFGEDISFYQTHGHFGKNSQIANLSPFLDDERILRVGGRIQAANVSFNVKHPIILPKGHPITKLIAVDYHQRMLHPGVSALFVLIRQEFWIIGCRNLLRKITHDCIKCFRQRKATSTQIMGNLPQQRVQASRAFLHCGCDYAGPIAIKTKIGRKTYQTKGYISLFVCIATKAIHLELVSDLTTEAFLAALRRFIARRGKPSHIYSDNGTNFRGSAKQLSDMHRVTMSNHHNALVAESLARDAITWHFIPPSAPHFGGLWEAGVKSVKQHLKRVVGSDVLTFEQLYTLLTQIEALLNCRPLCQASDNDLDPLTPAHFIIGESYSAVPEPSLEIIQNRLSSWKSLQSKIQGYWTRWSMEYLTSLQQRPRWLQPQRNLQVNDLVVIKEANMPPGKWAMGRVINIHPGKDGHVRVVTLRTANGSLVRPIHKLAPLPIN